MLFLQFFSLALDGSISEGRFDVELEIFFKELDSVNDLKFHFGDILDLLLMLWLERMFFFVHLVLYDID